MNNRYLLYFLMIVSISLNLYQEGKAQYYREEDDTELPGRIFIAPDFGLVLGTVTRIEFSPSVGYHLTPRFILGTGGRFEYLKEKYFLNSNIDIQTIIYGYRLFSRLVLIKDLNEVIPLNVPLSIFAHAEFESLSLEERYFRLASMDSRQRFWLNSILAGGGINQQTGSRTSFNVMILWDLTNSVSSPYVNPIIKFGIQFYL
jgi:hypothetical protein